MSPHQRIIVKTTKSREIQKKKTSRLPKPPWIDPTVEVVIPKTPKAALIGQGLISTK